MNVKKIDFNEMGMPVFTGRDRGTRTRKEQGLDKLDASLLVEVRIPSNVYTITSSYFLGLFGPSIREAGSGEKFLERFRFDAPDYILEKIDDWIVRALREPSDLFKGERS